MCRVQCREFHVDIRAIKGSSKKSWPILQEIFYDNIKLKVKEIAQNIRL